MVLPDGFEPPIPSLQVMCITTLLREQVLVTFIQRQGERGRLTVLF